MPSAGPQVTVLFAEDEAPLRDLLTPFLRRHGFHVLVAEDGKQALEIARHYEGEIQLLLSDIQMPEITGPQLAAELRCMLPQVKVILISGYADGLLLLDQGWVFLPKPFQPQEILAKIQEVLAHSPAPETDRGPS